MDSTDGEAGARMKKCDSGYCPNKLDLPIGTTDQLIWTRLLPWLPEQQVGGKKGE